MTELAMLLRIAENDAWSNLRLYRACRAVSQEDFERTDRVSFFPSLRETLEHNLLVQRFYLDALERGGRGSSVYAEEGSFKDAEALWTAQRVEDARLVALVGGLQEPELEERVVCAWRAGAREETRRNVLLHLLTHQTHHRGQVHAMLAGTSVKPPQLDEFFLDSDRPLREAEARDAGVTP